MSRADTAVSSSEAGARARVFQSGDLAGLERLGPESWADTMRAAAGDERALVRLSGALLGVGLFGIDRSERRDVLTRVGEGLAVEARGVFAMEREAGSLADSGRRYAARAWSVVTPDMPQREAGCAAIAALFGDVLIDELRALAGGWRSWQLPPQTADGRDLLAAWWTGRAW